MTVPFAITVSQCVPQASPPQAPQTLMPTRQGFSANNQTMRHRACIIIVPISIKEFTATRPLTLTLKPQATVTRARMDGVAQTR